MAAGVAHEGTARGGNRLTPLSFDPSEQVEWGQRSDPRAALTAGGLADPGERIDVPDDTPCKHPTSTVGVTYWPNGDHVIWVRCDTCGGNARGNGKWLSHTYDDWQDLPVFEDRRDQRPPCVVCGARGTEIHHWAPREMFGAEADLWPTAYLCQPCHGRWHVEINRARLARGGAA